MRALLFFLAVTAFGQTLPFPGPGFARGAASVGPPTATGKYCTNLDASANPITCTWSANPAAGEHIACIVFDYQSGSSSFSMTDSASNTYAANGAAVAGLRVAAQAKRRNFATFNIPGSISTTSVSNGGSPLFMGLFCFSYTGGVGAVDGAVGSDSSTSVSTSSASFTTVATNTIAFCLVDVSSGTTVNSAGSGWTILIDLGANLKVAYQAYSSSGSKSCSFNYDMTTAEADIIVASYK